MVAKAVNMLLYDDEGENETINIYKKRFLLSIAIKIWLYKVSIRPPELCPATGYSTKSNTEIIQKLQNKIIRVMVHRDRITQHDTVMTTVNKVSQVFSTKYMSTINCHVHMFLFHNGRKAVVK